MLLSEEFKFIMIHIQKTGGTSVERFCTDNGLAANSFHDSESYKNLADQNRTPGRLKHITAIKLKQMLKEEDWNSFFKFSIVRNPYDRLVSWFFMCKKIKNNSPQDNRFIKHVREKYESLEDFILSNDDMIQRTKICQFDYLSENNSIIVDKVFKTETLSSDIQILGKHLGVDIDLPHRNKSVHENYRHYYSDYLRGYVKNLHAKDFDYFDYSF